MMPEQNEDPITSGPSSRSGQFPGLGCLHLLSPLLRASKVTDAQVEGPGLRCEVGRSLDGVRPRLEGLVDAGVEAAFSPVIPAAFPGLSAEEVKADDC